MPPLIFWTVVAMLIATGIGLVHARWVRAARAVPLERVGIVLAVIAAALLIAHFRGAILSIGPRQPLP